MVDLAQHGYNGPVARQDICERQKISPDYTAQLFRRLQSAGLVEGVKGPGGGYRLTRDPTLIRAGDVVQAVEGPVAVVPCALPDSSEESGCGRVARCVTHSLWKQLSETMAEVLNSVSLKDLSDQADLLDSGVIG
jgi:Rrf2 family iron-sulfur cluster assembly transcriptional regulator